MLELYFKTLTWAGHRWLIPVILFTQETEIRAGSQFKASPGEILHETLSWKKLITKQSYQSGLCIKSACLASVKPWVQTPVLPKRIITLTGQVPVTNTCNPSYLGGWHQKDSHCRTAQAKSSQDPISTNKKLGMVVNACHPSHSGKLK
jgi:hypothetical protein